MQEERVSLPPYAGARLVCAPNGKAWAYTHEGPPRQTVWWWHSHRFLFLACHALSTVLHCTVLNRTVLGCCTHTHTPLLGSAPPNRLENKRLHRSNAISPRGSRRPCVCERAGNFVSSLIERKQDLAWLGMARHGTAWHGVLCRPAPRPIHNARGRNAEHAMPCGTV